MNCDDIRALLGEGDFCQVTSEGVRIQTHCLHPSFEQVSVYVVGHGDGFIVHDGGEAVSAVLRHGRDDSSMQSALKRASIRYGLDLEDGMLTAKADAAWLKSAILSVANGSALAAALGVEAAIEKQARALHDAILVEIQKVVPEQRIQSGYKYRGVSGREWAVDFGILSDRGPLLIKAVTPNANSISSGYTAFGDIGANDNIPRFAVHDQPLSPENQALMRQVAQLMPLPSVGAGIRRAMTANQRA